LPAQLRLCITRRSEGAADVPLELDRALPPAAFERVVLGSLSLASLHHIVRERLGTSPTRPVIARIAEASGGNPFFAIEIAGAIGGRAAGPDDHDPLPVPQSVQKLAAERVNALSDAAREAVLVAASLSRPMADAVVTALPDEPDGGAAIAEAEDTGVLVIEHGRIRFTHPLLASAVNASVSAARRRAPHRRLAEVVSDAEERARHLSQSLTDADEAVAIQIERAAQARSRAAARAARHGSRAADRPRLSPVTRSVSHSRTAPAWDTRPRPSADMTGDHHGRTAGMANLLARALDGLLGTHRYGQLGWYGSPIATPNLGALAAGGLLYTNMHMTSEPDFCQGP
jgi:predicted ATPase